LPRSKRGHKDGLVVGNLTGVIDSDYQGQWFVSAWNRNTNKTVTIEPYSAIAQTVFLQLAGVDFEEVLEFPETTERSDGGISKDVDTGN
jgi:dUTP pyrophosphatase